MLAISSSFGAFQQAVPWGIMHAPGIEKRIENGKGLPYGIEKKMERGFPNDDDQLLPIRQLRVTGITQTGAQIGWTTNVATTGTVLVSAVRPVTEAQASVFADASLAMGHSVAVTGLQADTTYFYVVKAVDAAGNVRSSATLSFKTAAHADVSAPRILGLFVLNATKDSARIVWVTDERADAKAWVSTASPVVTTGTSTQASADLGFFHELALAGLQPNTVYHYVVSSADAAGNVTFSNEASFMTAAQ